MSAEVARARAAPTGGPAHAVLGELELTLALVFAAFGLGAARLYPLWREHFHVACPLLEIAGIPCPTCGGTRALAALAAGDWAAAFGWNPAAALLGIGAIVALPVCAVLLIKPEWRPAVPQRLPPPLVAAGLLLLAANQVYLWNWFPR